LNPEIRNRERLNRSGKRRKPILNEIEVGEMKIIRLIFNIIEGDTTERSINAERDRFKIR
jgi:hypothetical protein